MHPICGIDIDLHYYSLLSRSEQQASVPGLHQIPDKSHKLRQVVFGAPMNTSCEVGHGQEDVRYELRSL